MHTYVCGVYINTFNVLGGFFSASLVYFDARCLNRNMGMRTGSYSHRAEHTHNIEIMVRDKNMLSIRNVHERVSHTLALYAFQIGFSVNAQCSKETHLEISRYTPEHIQGMTACMLLEC